MLDKTAILIFSRSPESEAKCKIISKDPNINRSLCIGLQKKTIKTASSSNLPFIHFSEEKQIGSSFAEKITNAISTSFLLGYDNLIIIGTDCPDLTKDHIVSANAALLSGKDIIAGQDCRGGIYLMGINKNTFNRSAFLNFSWQTRTLFKDIQNYSGSFQFCRLSSVLIDINSKKDAIKSLSLFNVSNVWKKIAVLLFNFIQNKQSKIVPFVNSPAFTSTQILRGPPSPISQ